jgi:exosome complex RNA-binding protein Rrp42 (RNase PH superfamily)
MAVGAEKLIQFSPFTSRAINPVKYLRNYLEKSIRSDGRELLEFRPTIINVDSISKADGSALVKIGSTTVICGIKAVSFLQLPSNLHFKLSLL